jgi:radical SAM protein with 4Fe4S-binding SPASM domain
MAWFHDLRRLLHVLSFRKVWNYGLLHASYHITRLSRRIIRWGRPAFISVEPTTICNLKCPQCFTTDARFTRPKGKLDAESFENIVRQASQTAFYLNLYFQGEPFLHENLSSFIKTAKQRGFYVSVSTNAHYLSEDNITKIMEAGLDRLIVSLDGTDAETYQHYRQGGDFEKVVSGIKALAEKKHKLHQHHPFIELQFLLHAKNEFQRKQIKAFGKSLGVDRVSIKSLQLIHEDGAAEWLPQQGSRYNVTPDGSVAIKSRLPNRCFRMWNSCVVTWDGDVVPCCFDKNADYTMGNLNRNSLNDIWENAAYGNFRKKVFTKRKNIGICRNCSEGL